MKLTKIFLYKAIPVLLIFFSISCQTKKDKEKYKEENAGVSGDLNAVQVTDGPCDTSIWRFVYIPERLRIIDKCKTVTGIIEESNADPDGDQHMLLKLDNGQSELLTRKNITKKQGDLVIEAVCVNEVFLKKVGSACKGYINNIVIPRVGDHVKVTGSLVNDTHNGWNEIHPITKIEILKVKI
jgi:hypothetical protein